MAKRKTAAARTQIVRMPAAPAPIIRIAAPRAAPIKKPKRKSHRRSGGGSFGGFVSSHNIDMGITGFGVGYALKNGYVDKLPALPFFGKVGTAAIAMDYYSKHGGGDMARRAAAGFAFLAGVQLAQNGKIDGDETDVSPVINDGEDD